MIRIIKDIKKYDNYYNSRYMSYLSFYFSEIKEDEFLKLYKEYIGNDFPVFAKVLNNNTKFITEKPIEDITKELNISLNKLSKYTKDKRIVLALGIISDIILFLHEGYIIANEISFDNIHKDYMNGGILSYTFTTNYNSHRNIEYMLDIDNSKWFIKGYI